MIGNGDKVMAFEDKWTRRPSSFRPITIQNEQQRHLLVREFFNADTREWDSDRLKETLWPSDIPDILSIPLGIRSSEDKIIWDFEKSGHHSIRFRYRVFNKSASSLSLTYGIFKFWNSLWRLNIHSEMKVFMWRLIHDGLPSLVALIYSGFCALKAAPSTVLTRPLFTPCFVVCGVGTLEWHYFLEIASQTLSGIDDGLLDGYLVRAILV